MAKTKRKWIRLDWNDPDALRAQDIPYDANNSIKDKIDAIPTSSFQSGKINLVANTNNITVTFPNPYPDTNYVVTCNLSNLVDPSPSIYSHIITSKTTTGFTVLFSGDIDSSNYVLEWMAK